MLILNSILSLNLIKTGEEVLIEQNFLSGKIRERTYDFGVIKGALIKCIGRSALGDPTAYKIGGTTFALRSKDAEKIIVRRAQ